MFYKICIEYFFIHFSFLHVEYFISSILYFSFIYIFFFFQIKLYLLWEVDNGK